MSKKRLGFGYLVIIFFIGILFGQAPPPDLTGEALKQWLRDNTYTGKIDPLGYTTARMYMYNYIDNHNNTITDVYGGYEKYWTYGGTGTNPTPINCEHTVPQSYFNYADPMKSDIHHLFPAYDAWNSTRSNYPFAEIPDTETTKWMRYDQSQSGIPTSFIDEYSEYANGKFEPREDHKGNVARAIFYFYTMYPTEAGPIDQVADPNTLFQWHLQDPVDAQELDRNAQIEQYQGNRNPYIDNPELVARAWGFTNPNMPPATPANLTLTPSSADLTLTWTDGSDEDAYHVYRSTDGNTFNLLTNLSANTISYTDGSVSSGTIYYYYVTASNTYGESNPSATVSGQLSGGSGTFASDLFISEYVEGSSYNKALEIANFTGQDVDLSVYALTKQTNGAGDWVTPLNLSGTLPHGQVYVVVNSSAGSTLLSKADLTTGNSVVTFNGNDPVALMKNSQVIDIIGTFNGGTADFAKDVTLRRNSDVSSPNTVYTPSEWTALAQDDFSDVGMHTFVGDGTTPMAFNSGPVAGNITTTSAVITFTANQSCNADLNYGLTSGMGTHQSETGTDFSINITNLQPNTTYYYQVTLDNGTETVTSAQYTFTTLLPIPAVPAGLALNSTESEINLTWNDVQYETNYHIFRSTDNINFAEIAMMGADVTSFTDIDVSQGVMYYYYITASNNSGSSSPSTIVSGELQVPQGTSELFFSEYVEGSSYNKALEIANFTGQSVNLSEYSIKIAVNGSSSWGTEYFLSGNLQNQDVYVVVNSSAKKSLRKKADVTTGSAVMNYNGNDVLGLFHNGQLIDVIGNLGSSTYFAKDVTLRRKANVANPSVNFDINEWDSYSRDTFNGLGTHTVTGAGITLLSSDDQHAQLSQLYSLEINSPNPFNPSTVIPLSIPQNETGYIRIFNMNGQLVRTIPVHGGVNQIVWDATDEHGQIVATGVYVYQLMVRNRIIDSRKMLFLK